jgi:hypothetical protein
MQYITLHVLLHDAAESIKTFSHISGTIVPIK